MQLYVSSKVSNFAYVIPGARRSYCFCVLLTTLSTLHGNINGRNINGHTVQSRHAHYFSFVLDFNLKL